MRDRVRRHQQFEAKEPRQKLLAHVGRPAACVLARAKLVTDMVDDRVEERSGSAGRVEDEDARRGRRLFRVFVVEPLVGDGCPVG